MRRPLVLVLLACGAAIGWLAVRSPPAPEEALPGTGTPAPGSAAQAIDPLPPAPNVPRPSSVDTPPSAASPSTAWIPAPSPSMAKQAEANQRSVREARDTGKYPERLGAHVRPAPFDLARWRADPQRYLDVVEPGRVFQTAPPGPRVKPILAPGYQVREVEPGNPATLEVHTEPDAPVTFTAFGPGAFENGLGSITVRADKKGTALAIFVPPPDAEASVRILAASPLSSGQAVFHVGVKD